MQEYQMGFFRQFASKLTIVASLFLGPLAACQAPVYPAQPNLTDTQANSVFKVVVHDGSGTAWIVKNEEDKSYLITAGHVCTDDEEMSLVPRSGEPIPAHRIMAGDYPDLCEIYTDTVVGVPLPLADKLPVYDQELWTISAPAGVWGGGLAPVFHVRYIGGDKFAGAIYPGTSGGPVISKDGVVGVAVAGWFGAQIGEFVTVKVLRDWMDVKEIPGEGEDVLP